jgi:type II secretory pathway component PulF
MTGSDRQPLDRPIRSEDAVQILEQSALAAQAGVPLAPGLRAMAAEAPSRRTRIELNRVADRLDAGEPLPEILLALQPQLSPLTATLVELSSEIGRLDTLLHWAAEFGRRRRTLQWSLRTALAYPVFLTLIAVSVWLVLLVVIVPMFKRIFSDFGTQLPALTRLIMGASDLATRFWPIGVAIAIPVTIALCVVLFSQRWILSQRWSGGIPIIGKLFYQEAIAEFCHLSAVFIELRLPLQKSIRLTGQSTHFRWLQNACENLAEDVESGQLTDHSALSLGFPVAVSQLLSNSADSAATSEALHGIGELYTARIIVQSRLIATAIEPFILILTVVSIGSIIVALILPLVSLLNALS